MKATGHLAITAVIAGGSFLATQSPVVALSTLGIGVLIDGDHTFDYGLYLIGKKGKQKASLSQFLDCSYMEDVRRTYLPLHSWELAPVIWGLSLALLTVPLSVWLTISFLAHLLTDQISHKPHPLCYFFTFRALKRFDGDTLCGADKKRAASM